MRPFLMPRELIDAAGRVYAAAIEAGCPPAGADEWLDRFVAKLRQIEDREGAVD